MQLINSFGPPLVKLQADEKVIHELNDCMDKIIQHKKDIPAFFPYVLKKGVFENIENFVMALATDFHRKFTVDKDVESTITIEEMCILSQREHVWNHFHFHTGTISGVLYLKMPEVLWNLPMPQDTSGFNPGGITFAAGSPGPYHRAIVNVRPAVGEIYLFPSTVPHTVYPFSGPGERRCFAFNLNVVKKL
jgi:hypothetical protein